MIRNIDIDLLRAFLAIYESGSFSQAADRLGRTQSSVSQQIKKLEEILTHDVFLRNNRSVSLTTEGEVLLPYARKMVGMNDEVFGRISKADICGGVRLGAPEAFAANHLPGVLTQFCKSHPSVKLEVHCDVSHNLRKQFEQGNLDLILIKRDGKTKIYGNKIWRETLVWAGRDKKVINAKDVLPLVLSPSPCVYRHKITTALDKANIPWRAAFTCSSMSGRMAAARAGLGITALPQEMLAQAHGLIALRDDCGLPILSSIEIDLLQNRDIMSDAATRLAEHIIFALENNPSISSLV